MELSIKILIDTQLLKEQEERKDRARSGKWSPSSFGQCLRRQYWNRLNEPQSNPVDVNTLARFKAGNLFEEYIFSLLPSSIQRQVLCETEDVKGFADGVVEDEVLEAKSQHSRKFWHINKERQAVDNFSISDHNPEHILQAGWYAMILNKPFIRLVYVSKDDLCTDEYKIPMTVEIKNKIIEEINNLNFFWAIKQLPPANPRLYKDKKTGELKECQYCNWKDLCDKTEGKS